MNKFQRDQVPHAYVDAERTIHVPKDRYSIDEVVKFKDMTPLYAPQPSTCWAVVETEYNNIVTLYNQVDHSTNAMIDAVNQAQKNNEEVGYIKYIAVPLFLE